MSQNRLQTSALNNPDERLILAIDQGGQSSRVAVYRTTGEQVIMFSAACATRTFSEKPSFTGQHVHVEQDGEEILAGIRTCLEHIADALGEKIRDITAAGFAGQGSSLLGWHRENGAALSPVISWQDRRGEPLLHNFPLSQDQVQQRTGIRISPHYGASKIRWCFDYIEAVKSAAMSNHLMIGPIASYLFCNLLNNETAQIFIDPGHAQRTLLWNLFSRDWDRELLDCFKIDPAVLPVCVSHNSTFGHLTLRAHDIPLISCQRDQGASLFARGVPEVDACYVNIGTGAFIQRVTGQLDAPAGLLVSPLWLPDPSSASARSFYAWEATVNGAAAATDWLQKEIGMEITPQLIDAALATESRQDAYFLNAIGGLSAPYWRTDLTSRFSGVLSPVEKIQAWLESVVFQLLINFQLMQSLGQAKRIYISGGLSRAEGLCQRLADLTGLPVLRNDNTDATLQGVAFTAAGMPAHWQAQSQDEHFSPRLNPLLQQRFVQWQNAMQRWLNETAR